MLINTPHLRDDDMKLICTIWWEDYKDDQGEEVYNFLKKLCSGKMHLPESIRRTRQKLQEERSYLRGDNYGKRQKKAGEIKKVLMPYKD